MAAAVVLAVALGLLAVAVARALDVLVWRPRRLSSLLRKQGIGGPPPSSFLLGNIPDIKRIGKQSAEAASATETARPRPEPNGQIGLMSHAWPSVIFPHLEQWRKEYGPIFIYSTGNIHLLSITDAEMVKELSLHTALSLGKPSYQTKDLEPLLGNGILSSSGPYWAHQKKIIAPELYPDKVKGMLSLMVASTNSLLRSWEQRVEEAEGDCAEINGIDEDLRSLSADIISKACFGSSYSQGKEIFLKLEQLQKVMSKGSIGIPGLRYVPTKHNREMWMIEKEIRSKILEVVKVRSEGPVEKDLLQMILEGAKACSENGGLPSNISTDKFIVDNCKNIYFAGHETTAVTASWSLILLAAYPEWQDRTREEVLQVLGDDQSIDSNKLQDLKVLTMVIQETLRLYTPAAFVVREAREDIQFRKLYIPKGLGIQFPISLLHRDPETWGPDAMEFNPGRFSQGISGACKLVQAYIPFGLGPRVCAGQHMAMAELKVILSLILMRFRFSLSKSYKHCPALKLMIQPGNGVTLRMSRL